MTKHAKDFLYWEHLEELRGRIIKCIIVIAIASCFFYRFTDALLEILVRPVGQLYFIGPSEAFLAKMALTLIGGTAMAMPVLFYQVWAFISSALTETEKKYVLVFAPFSFLLFIGGILFAYFSVLPLALKFLLSFASQTVVPMITVYKYIAFVGTFCLGFGAVFEMPLVIVFLTRVGIATPAFLIQMRRQAIVIIFVVSAFLTPPDYVSQVLMALPLLLLYETSIVCSKLTYRLRGQSQ